MLSIKNISKSDRGVYKCLASNLIGYGAEWTLKVSVRCKILIVFMVVRLFNE